MPSLEAAPAQVTSVRRTSQLMPRPLWLSGALLLSTLVLGLTLRFAPLGWPRAIAKYGGSVTWALMVYWLLSTLAGRWPPWRLVPWTFALTAAVEFLKRWHTPGLDAFRQTLAGILLLGRHFSYRDILAYWIAIAAGATLDLRLRHVAAEPRRQPTQVA